MTLCSVFYEHTNESVMKVQPAEAVYITVLVLLRPTTASSQDMIAINQGGADGMARRRRMTDGPDDAYLALRPAAV